jgi:hypothetical protein
VEKDGPGSSGAFESPSIEPDVLARVMPLGGALLGPLSNPPKMLSSKSAAPVPRGGSIPPNTSCSKESPNGDKGPDDALEAGLPKSSESSILNFFLLELFFLEPFLLFDDFFDVRVGAFSKSSKSSKPLLTGALFVRPRDSSGAISANPEDYNV